MNGGGDKDIRVLSTPDEPNDWPHPPIYEPLWPYGRAEVAFEECRGTTDRNTLLHSVIGDYDLALSKALFYIWQLEGLLKGKE